MSLKSHLFDSCCVTSRPEKVTVELTGVSPSSSLTPLLLPLGFSGSDDEDEEEKKRAWPPGGDDALYMDDFLDFDAPFNCRLSLKDFDTLIHDLDRELAKQICL